MKKRCLEIIPAILSKTKEDMIKKVSLVAPHVKMIHIDMMDGKFVPNTTLSTGETAGALDPKRRYIFHWMVERPEEEIPKLGRLSSGNLHLVHAEILNKSRWAALKKLGVLLGIAINPETPLSTIAEYIEETEDFLIMSVHPGFSNQKYIQDVEEKIRELRKKKPNANIEVDGGIEPETAKRAVMAGANWLASASAIFGKDDVKNAIEEIKRSVRGLSNVQKNK